MRTPKSGGTHDEISFETKDPQVILRGSLEQLATSVLLQFLNMRFRLVCAKGINFFWTATKLLRNVEYEHGRTFDSLGMKKDENKLRSFREKKQNSKRKFPWKVLL